MSESADYNPGVWKGVKFDDAYKTYDAHAGRSYGDATAKKLGVGDLVPESLETDSESPVAIICDVTGSMGEWPKTIFSKLPYLDIEGKEYMGDDMAISFSAVGDMFSDRYPLQVQTFARGKDMEESLKKLVVEGGGGGSSEESYDLPALYYARNVRMPKAIRKPLLIMIGDEGLYSFVDSEGAKKYCYTEIDKKFSMQQLFDELKAKFSVYMIRKPFQVSGNSSSPRNDAIQTQWVGLLGEDHVVSLPDASRVVDVIFGIMAKETGRVDYFKGEIEGRQTKDQVKVVMKSLATVHRIAGPEDSVKKLAAPGKSITRRAKGGDSKPSKSLLD